MDAYIQHDTCKDRIHVSHIDTTITTTVMAMVTMMMLLRFRWASTQSSVSFFVKGVETGSFYWPQLYCMYLQALLISSRSVTYNYVTIEALVKRRLGNGDLTEKLRITIYTPSTILSGWICITNGDPTRVLPIWKKPPEKKSEWRVSKGIDIAKWD